MTATTTTIFRIFLIELAMGMYVLISHSRTPATIKTNTKLIIGIATLSIVNSEK